MSVKKFGLKELESYVDTVGVKRGDVRTIKGVLSIVGIPNTIVSEAESVIGECVSKVEDTNKSIQKIATYEAVADSELKRTISNLKDGRKNEKDSNQVKVIDAVMEVDSIKSEISRLKKLLKKFS